MIEKVKVSIKCPTVINYFEKLPIVRMKIKKNGGIYNRYDIEFESDKTESAVANLPNIIGNIFGITIALTGLVLGGFISIYGILISLTIVGAIIGIPLVILGIFVIYGGFALGAAGIYAGKQQEDKNNG